MDDASDSSSSTSAHAGVKRNETEEDWEKEKEKDEDEDEEKHEKEKKKKGKKDKKKKKRVMSEEEEVDDNDDEQQALVKKKKKKRSKWTSGERKQRREERRLLKESEPRINISGAENVRLKDVIRRERALYRPGYKPVFVAVTGLNYSVKVPPPTTKNPHLCPPEPPSFLHPCIKSKKKVKLDVLKDISFYLKPKEMTLLLGAPGCGKSTLFKLLANRLRYGKVEGSMTFNGHKPKAKYFHRDVAYVTQEDQHVAAMTVKETLKFSAACQMPSTLPRASQKQRIEVLLQLLGLRHRADTVVGDALLRGVSGGEKKRVTIGIECTKAPALWLLDEPTTGLDASAAYDVLRVMRTVCDTGPAVFVALLQPSYEIFKLFHNVMILTKGEIAYYGPREKIIPYFADLGYHCHPHINPAEFLQEVVESAHHTLDPDKFRHLKNGSDSEADDNNDDAGAADDGFHWMTRDEFVDHFRNSELAKDIGHTIDEETEKFLEEDKDKPEQEKGSIIDRVKHLKKSREEAKIELSDYSNEAKYPTGIPRQLYLLTKRALTKERRDAKTPVSRLIAAVLMSFVLGTLFLQTGNGQKDARTKLGLIFSILSYFAFNALASLPPFLTERPILYMQRDGKYYTTLPYLIANIVSDIPVTLVETALYGTITYWMTGLNTADTGGRYGYFILLCFSEYMMSKSLCRLVSSFAPNFVAANSIAPAILCIYLLFAGYIIPRSDIPGWWIWVYWINPLAYVFQGFMINEFWDSTYHCSSSNLVPPPSIPNFNTSYPDGYEGNQICPITDGMDWAILKFDAFHDDYMKWIMVIITAGWWLLFTFLTYLCLRFVRHKPKLPVRPQEHKKVAAGKDPEEVEMEDQNAPKGKEKNDNEDDTDENKESDKYGLFGKKEGAYLSWHNLGYEVKGKIDGKKTSLKLLNEVSGYVKPGMMLALMGSSGAGKSTLLDVLARRKTGGKITGEVLVNGEKPDDHLNRMIGYVEQQDVHLGSQTVLEALEFSAMCRLPGHIPRKQKLRFARSLLTILGLEDEANVMIGSSPSEGISGDQRKRVTIGVELASNPSILFLDEPTSGLDSFGASRVMSAVRNVAQQGTPVICTIHQPSASLFGLFSHLLLLRKGGYVTYFGPIGKRPNDFSLLLKYFSENLGAEMPAHKNPADFILEAIGAGIPKGTLPAPPPVKKKNILKKLTSKLRRKQGKDEQTKEKKGKESESDDESEDDENGGSGDDSESSSSSDEEVNPLSTLDKFVAAYRASDLYEEAEKELNEGIFPGGKQEHDGHHSPAMVPIAWVRQKTGFSGRYASPFWLQLFEVMKRGFLTYWRDPTQVKAKMLRSLLFGCLMGTLFLQMDESQAGAGDRVSLIYFSLTFANLTAISSIPKIQSERSVYYRERASATYRSLAYTFTLILVEIPFTLIAALLFTVPMYFIGGLQYDAGKFFIFLALYALANLLSLSLCQAIGIATPNQILANAFLGTILSLFGLFAGFLITRTNIPKYWIWMYYLDMTMYCLESTVVNELDGLNLHCKGSEYYQIPIPSQNVTKPFCGITSGKQFMDTFDLSYDHLLRDSLVMLGFYIAFITICGLLLKFVNHQKR